MLSTKTLDIITISMKGMENLKTKKKKKMKTKQSEQLYEILQAQWL